MEIVLALCSAALFALGTVLQQRAGLAGEQAGGSGLLVRMARHPVWLAGIACDALGFVAQAAALGAGRLAVVQPLLVTSIVFALPLGAWLSHQRLHRRDVAAGGAVVLALVLFLTLATPSGGHQQAPLHRWLIAGAACALVCAPLALLARHGPAPRRAALWGCAAGILFALSAALTKSVVDELHRGPVAVLESWPPYALAAVGYVSMTFNQLALNTGALAATIATSTALDPIASVALGLGLFGESLPSSPLTVVATLAAIVCAVGALIVLARAQAHSLH